MAETRKILRVFFASPGDLQEERRAAKSAIDEVNQLLGDNLGYHVELVGWEDTVSVWGRPQSTINVDLAKCELFIGVMWKKWGTPPSTSVGYTSGFEEEFRSSTKSREESGRPEISLYFKSVPSDLLVDPGDDLKKVIAFREQIESEKKILFETFEAPLEFEKKVRRCVVRYIQRLRDEETASAEATQPRPATITNNMESPAGPPKESSLSAEGARFLRDFIDKTERDLGEEPLLPEEVARFRLLAASVKQQGNDDESLGVHDANLLFNRRYNIEFGRREQSALVNCGLQQFSAENVPLWHWLIAVGRLDTQLSMRSWFGSVQRRVGAIDAMRLIAQPLRALSGFDRGEIVGTWLSNDTPNAVKTAGLKYLGECGLTEDLPALEEETETADHKTSSLAAEAVIRINLRKRPLEAMQALFKLQPESVSSSLLKALFSKASDVPTEILLDGVNHRSDAVRRLVARELRVRRALSADVAQRLRSDSDAFVRLEAVRALRSQGVQFSREDARGALVKPMRPGLGFGLGLTGIFGHGATDRDGEEAWKLCHQDMLSEASDAELERLERSSVDADAFLTIVERKFSTRGDELREALDDDFHKFFEGRLGVVCVGER